MTESSLIRQRLLDRRRQIRLVLESGRTAAATVELDQAKVGRLSRMDALQVQAMQQETGRRHQLELQKIEAALQRLQANEYGYCLRCDEPISAARLEVDPAATLCIRCAETVAR